MIDYWSEFKLDWGCYTCYINTLCTHVHTHAYISDNVLFVVGAIYSFFSIFHCCLHTELEFYFYWNINFLCHFIFWLLKTNNIQQHYRRFNIIMIYIVNLYLPFCDSYWCVSKGFQWLLHRTGGKICHKN